MRTGLSIRSISSEVQTSLTTGTALPSTSTTTEPLLSVAVPEKMKEETPSEGGPHG